MDEETRNLIKYGQRKRPRYAKRDDGGLSWPVLIALLVAMAILTGMANSCLGVQYVSW